MKRLAGLVLTILLATTTLAACSSGAEAQTVGAQEWLTQAGKPDVTVVDVRTPAEYAAGHVEGAVNIDVDGASFSDAIAELDKDGTYVVYCQSGRRSGIATDAMTKAGLTHVYNLDGGIGALQAAGATIVAG